MKTTRRDFIKISTAGAGGLALANPIMNFLKDEEPMDDSKAKRYPTYCEICFWKCAGWTYTNEEGKIWKIIGNEDDQHSNGRFCPRGTGGVGQYYDEDRLKKPLKRVVEGNQQKFVEVSWDEAFDYIAEKMKYIARKYGPECVALFTHGSGGKYFGNLLKAYGSTNISKPSYAQCRGPREVGFITTFGRGINSPEPTDIRNTRCLVLIGSHLGENMHNGQVQEMAEAIDKGASIITVDPRYSTAASKSKFWLPIKPATDIALLLAWMNVLIENGWYDKEYVEKYTFGFDQLKAHVKDKTPEWAYGITGLRPEDIIASAREMYEASPAVIIHPGRHVTWYGDDTQRSRSIAILNALLGSWGRRGGFYMPERAHVPHPDIPEFPKPRRTWRDAHPNSYPLAGTTLASAIADATVPSIESGCNFKGWIVDGTNLLTTIPNQENTMNAIQSLELLVVIDTMPVEIAGYADIVLPECTYLERYDSLRVSQHRQPAIALRMPAAEPRWDTKPAYWMARELAKKLGLEAYFPFEKLEDELDWELQQIGSSLEEMKRIGVKTLPRHFDDLYFRDGEDIEFYTNSGKIELYSTMIANSGYDPLPNYTKHPEPPEGFYRLNYGRAPMHSFGRTINNPNLNDLMDHNVLWVNPKVAKIWGIENEQEVWLKNQDGIVSDFPIKVRITERIRWDSVYMVHGFGSTRKKMSRAYRSGIMDTTLMSTVMVDPIMGGTGMRGNFVTFLTEKPEKEDNV